MSTKIYNAYKINDMTITEIMVKLQILRKRNFEEIQNFLVGWGEKRVKLYCEGETLYKVLKKEASMLSYSAFNFGYDVVLFFHNDNIYIQFFGNDNNIDHEEIFDGKLEDFHYQNQSDPWFDYKEEITTEDYKAAEENWVLRKKVWDEIFSDNWVPSKCGLTFNIYSPDDAFKVSCDFYQPNEK